MHPTYHKYTKQPLISRALRGSAVFVILFSVAFLSVESVAAVSEGDPLPCGRWPYASGGTFVVSYAWGNRLQDPGTSWRSAFEAAVNDWNAVSGYIKYGAGGGRAAFNTYSAQDGRAGVTNWTCQSGQMTYAEVLGNVAYAQSGNTYHAIAGHEAGHGLALGHITDPPPTISLMGYNPDANLYYTPQPPDVQLLNQVYP